MPSTPRTPKPPGTSSPSMPAAGSRARVARSMNWSLDEPRRCRRRRRWRCRRGSAPPARSCSCPRTRCTCRRRRCCTRSRGATTRCTISLPRARGRALAARGRAVCSTLLVEPLLAEGERDLVDRRHVAALDHGAELHVAEERDLALDVVGERAARCGRSGCRAGFRSPSARAPSAASASSSPRRRRRCTGRA